MNSLSDVKEIRSPFISLQDVAITNFKFSVLNQQTHIKHLPIINPPIVVQSMVVVYLVH